MTRKYFKAAEKLPKRIADFSATYPNLKNDLAAIAVYCGVAELLESDTSLSVDFANLLAKLNENPEVIPSTATIRNYLKAPKAE